MAIEINLKAEDIERLVKDSIMAAGFGKAIQDGLSKAMSGYNNPIEEQLKRYVGKVCGEIIEQHYATEIREAVKAEVEKRVTAEIIQKTTDAAVSRMIRAAEESRY